MQTKYFSVHSYVQSVETNKRKRLFFPILRGTWLPSIDRQVRLATSKYTFGGYAINWLGVRVKLSF